MTATWHEDFIDYDAQELYEPDADDYEFRVWAEQTLNGFPDVRVCDGCDQHVTSALGAFVPGLPDGTPMVAPRRTASGFFCPNCVEVQKELGWFEW